MSMSRAIAKTLIAVAVFSSSMRIAYADAYVERTQNALSKLQTWLGDNENGDRWRAYLHLPLLEEQIPLGEQADPADLMRVLKRFESDAAGLDLPRFVDVRNAVRDWRGELVRRLDLPAIARVSSEGFSPVIDADVARAKQQVAARARELAEYLGTGENGMAWKRYLQWNELQAQLAEGAEPDQGQIAKIIDKLTANEEGLELPEFQQLARALERYQALIALRRVEEQQQLYSSNIEALVDDLSKYERTPSRRLSHSIGIRVGSINAVGKSPELVSAVREKHARPNFYLDATTDFLNRAAARDVNDVGPVRDCILGTSISGTGTTTGSLVVQTLPANDRARFLLTIHGHTDAHTVGYNGPAVMRSTSDTDFTSRKLIEITDPSFWVYPADVDATTSSHTYSVQKKGGGLGSRIVTAIASRQVSEKKAQADAIASQHAEDRIGSEMNDEVMEQIRKARDRYTDEFRRPLQRRNAFPELIRFSSTESSISLEAMQATQHQLAASTPPPAVPEGHDIALRLNHSAVENGLAILLGGATLTQTTADDEPKLDHKIPDWLQEIFDERQGGNKEPAPDFKPWSITFRRHRPVSVEFGDNKITATIHAARLTTGEENYDNWDLIATFSPHEQNGLITLIREGEIDVLPTDFDPTEGKQLRRREIALRNNLSKELNERADRGEGLPEVIEIEPIELSEDLNKLGMLWVRRLEPNAGWLTIGLNAE